MTNKQQASLSFINNCKLKNGISFNAEMNAEGGLYMTLIKNNHKWMTFYNGLDSEVVTKREIRKLHNRKFNKQDEINMDRVVRMFINFYN